MKQYKELIKDLHVLKDIKVRQKLEPVEQEDLSKDLIYKRTLNKSTIFVSDTISSSGFYSSNMDHVSFLFLFSYLSLSYFIF